jgi:chromosome segregation ATPase
VVRVFDLEGLSREDVDVLREVVGQDDGRGVTAGEVQQMLGWAEENHHVTYRYDKLEDAGYVETEKDPERGPSNQLPPRVARATEEGEELVEAVEYEPEDRALDERVERLEKQIEPLRETYGKMKKRIAELEEEVESHDEDLEDVSANVRSLRRAVEQLPAFAEDEFEFADD